VIVLGGPGFNYYARDWLAYLGVDYGLRGEGEESFPLFLGRLQSGGDLLSVPGCVGRTTIATRSVPPATVSDPNNTALPACDLLDLPQYEAYNITPAVLTKRGCAFHCSYCPYASLEGNRYRLKSPQRVVQEVKQILNVSHSRRVQLCDNSFNAPVAHAADLCRAFITERLDFQWGTGDLKPIGVTDAFCHLLEDSGCYYASLAAESASESMLKNMWRGYGVRQVCQSLDALSRSKVPYGISLMFGAPGETPETVEESLRLVEDYEYPAGVWVTMGIYLWTDYQQMAAQAHAAGELDDHRLFEGTAYLSPMLKEDYLRELRTRLAARPGWKVQFNQPPHRLPSGCAQ